MLPRLIFQTISPWRTRASGLALRQEVRQFYRATLPLLNDDASKTWLAEKRQDSSVVELESGLMYKVIKEGSVGAPSPLLNSPCVCHYEGKLIDGTEFDSSRRRGSPMTFAPSQVIPGWTEALQLMKEGDEVELYIPSVGLVILLVVTCVDIFSDNNIYIRSQ